MGLNRLDLSEESERVVESLLEAALQAPASKKQFLSGRRTKKKIEKAYDALTAMHFPFDLVEEALSHAHDLTGALQYICLYHSSADLPSTFRAYAQKAPVQHTADEEEKPQLTFVPAAAPTAPLKGRADDGCDEIKTSQVPKEPTKKEIVQDKEDAKAWTLRYLEMQEREEDHSPEEKRRQLELDIEHAMTQLKGVKKSKKNEIAYWQAEIVRLKAELSALPQANVVVVVDEDTPLEVPQVLHLPIEDEEDDDDGGMEMFSMLESTAVEAVIAAPVVESKPTAIAVPQVKWTGKTPRMQLQEYCQKHKWTPPQYTANSSRGKYNYRLSVRRGKQQALAIDVPEIYATIDSAKDAVATRALYVLMPQLPLHRGLPPYYRDMWLEWVREVEDEARQAKSITVASKSAIIDGLFGLLADVDAPLPSSVPAPTEAAAVLDSWDSDGEDESWEDQADDVVAPVALPVSTISAPSPKKDEAFAKLMQSKRYRAFLPTRAALPIAAHKNKIIESTHGNSVVLVSGETGSGKSTQVPHYLLEDMLVRGQDGNGLIMCTQPRRLAAIGVAERVSEEMGEVVGTGYVGYQIRLEQKKSPRCKLVFCTTGILLRQLQTNPTLDGVSHVVVDEIHERDVQCDVLLGLLRRLVLSRPSLKLVLMSATLNAELFQAYFRSCDLITVPGRLYPVEKLYLEDVFELTQHVIHEGTKYCRSTENEASSYSLQVTGRGGRVAKQVLTWHASDLRTKDDAAAQDDGPYSVHTLAMMDKVDPSVINYDLIEDLVANLVLQNKSVAGDALLIFLSGRAEIRTLIDQLGANRSLAARCLFLPLHASLSTTEQHNVFNHYPNKIKVIVSTNIAETSLTIDDITIVIDAGRVKQMRHDAKTQTSFLNEVWIAQANANQRAGRAGRVQAGKCFRLYPKYLFDDEMLAQPVAEIHRAPLTSLSLQLHELVPTNCAGFWHELLESPSEQAILDATNELVQLGALSDGAMTPLGHHLAKLPLDVRLGKMLLFAAIFGCTRPIAVVAAMLESKSPFVTPFGQEKEATAKRQLFQTGDSDLLTDLAAFQAWAKLPSTQQDAFCKRHFLHRGALQEIQKLATSFERLLRDLGFAASHDDANKFSGDTAVVNAVVAAGLYPNVVLVEPDEKQPTRVVRFWERQKQVFLHPSSINHGTTLFRSPWLGYHLKLKTSRVYLPVSSGVTPLALALFGGQFDMKLEAQQLTIDAWIDLPCAGRTAMLLYELRRRLSILLERKLDAPSAMDSDDRALVDTVALLWAREAAHVA
ncbi:Aste57867_21231 [Aphanomyces stellatus]|uniref:RNA helicase n=1 Tax=Aphanomyces stellatus TaxID=120398 RepID=A0A485LIF2_9STRA|nr:hypothetical protein As57867_021163 [Aphanomyces stellatus]VFT97903.1 Aste57867_21231 [Aphanomyces stellatus]